MSQSHLREPTLSLSFPGSVFRSKQRAEEVRPGGQGDRSRRGEGQVQESGHLALLSAWWYRGSPLSWVHRQLVSSGGQTQDSVGYVASGEPYKLH